MPAEDHARCSVFTTRTASLNEHEHEAFFRAERVRTRVTTGRRSRFSVKRKKGSAYLLLSSSSSSIAGASWRHLVVAYWANSSEKSTAIFELFLRNVADPRFKRDVSQMKCVVCLLNLNLDQDHFERVYAAQITNKKKRE